MALMEMTVMDQKKEFILLWKTNSFSFTDLCKEFNIARTTGYKYVKRFKEGGMDALENQSTAPHHVPGKTPPELEKRIIEIRKQKPRWGAKKITWRLEQDGVYKNIPALSTISLILKRNGLIKERKKHRRVEPKKPKFIPEFCNDIWSADYKGKFKMGNGKYCYPLTICDSYSRFIIEIKALSTPSFEQAKPVFESVFKVYGLPEQLHTDNGTPFASIRSLGRLSTFSVWLMELGILPVYSDPGCPTQNGSHERMHRELKADACKNPGKTLQGQQHKFSTFRREYNEERPHEALGMKLPISVYTRSKRLYPKKIEDWIYPGEYIVKYVCRNGSIRVGRSHWIFVSSALLGKKVGLEPLGNDLFRVYFRDYLLGYLDNNELKIYDIMEYRYVPKVY